MNIACSFHCATWLSFFVCTGHSKHHYSVNASRSKMPQVIQSVFHCMHLTYRPSHQSQFASRTNWHLHTRGRQTLQRLCSEFASQLVADPNPAAAFLCRCTWSVAECISVCYIVILTQPPRSTLWRGHIILRHNQPAAIGVCNRVHQHQSR